MDFSSISNYPAFNAEKFIEKAVNSALEQPKITRNNSNKRREEWMVH